MCLFDTKFYLHNAARDETKLIINNVRRAIYDSSYQKNLPCISRIFLRGTFILDIYGGVFRAQNSKAGGSVYAKS